MTPARIAWRLAAITDVLIETPNAKTLVLDVPGWPGHLAGQHVDIRLTAQDGYQAQRSYSIASAPEHDAVEIWRPDADEPKCRADDNSITGGAG